MEQVTSGTQFGFHIGWSKEILLTGSTCRVDHKHLKWAVLALEMFLMLTHKSHSFSCRAIFWQFGHTPNTPNTLPYLILWGTMYRPFLCKYLPSMLAPSEVASCRIHSLLASKKRIDSSMGPDRSMSIGIQGETISPKATLEQFDFDLEKAQWRSLAKPMTLI